MKKKIQSHKCNACMLCSSVNVYAKSLCVKALTHKSVCVYALLPKTTIGCDKIK